MRPAGRFALAWALCVALATVATAGTISNRDQQGLKVTELLRVAPLSVETSPALEDQIGYVTEILDGSRSFTQADVEERFVEGMADLTTVNLLQADIDALHAAIGTVGIVRVQDYRPPSGTEPESDDQVEAIRLLGVSAKGYPVDISIGVQPNGRIMALGYMEPLGGIARVATWELVSVLLAGWVMIVAAAAAWRYRGRLEAWILLAASILVLAGLLVLTDSSATYTAGRVVPAALVVPAAALLIGRRAGRRRSALLAVAVGGAVLGGLAPLVRDPAAIGHPSLWLELADNETAYRALLGTSAGLVALAMAAAVFVTAQTIRPGPVQLRQAKGLVTLVAALWAVAAAGSALDQATGDGSLAGGPFRGLMLAAWIALPLAVVFRLAVVSWARPELAALVIDLETEGVDLEAAIARALDDPSLQLLLSPDGEHLVDGTGHELMTDELPEGRSLTRIHSGSGLVGGLLHTGSLQRETDRLQAVAAAAGMALELQRLNRQVQAQLEEVEASRARILEASDAARRRLERDLHDGAQQRLVALGLRLQRASRQAGADNDGPLAELFEQATSDVRGALDEIRAVSRGSQPALLAERGLAPAVDALAERAPVPVRVDIDPVSLSGGAERAAFYVIAEALTNVAKHARATEAEVAVARCASEALVTVRDDGRGGATISPGSGLEGLSDRVAATGGTLELTSGANGTTLTAHIPCD